MSDVTWSARRRGEMILVAEMGAVPRDMPGMLNVVMVKGVERSLETWSKERQSLLLRR
jgi:hypothetical protein